MSKSLVKLSLLVKDHTFTAGYLSVYIYKYMHLRWTLDSVCCRVKAHLPSQIRLDSLDLTSMTRSILGFRSFTFLSQSLASSSSTSRKAPSNNPSLILATSNFSPSWRPSRYRRSFTPSTTSCVTESRETTSSHFVTLLCRTRRLSSATVMRTAKSRDEDFGKTA